MKSIDENAPDDVLRILVGNKSDLHQRIVISTQDGKKLANQYHVDYFETSAKSDSSPNVSKMFFYITEKLLDLKRPIPIEPGPPEPPRPFINCC
jgi:GTPase SAR1 family protein